MGIEALVTAPPTGIFKDFLAVAWPEDFGACGIGVDSGPAINAAIASLTHGGIVQLRQAQYDHSTEIDLNTSGVRLMGQGAAILGGSGGTVLRSTAALQYQLNIDSGDTGGIENVEVCYLTCRNTGTTQWAIRMGGVHNQIHHVVVDGGGGVPDPHYIAGGITTSQTRTVYHNFIDLVIVEGGHTLPVGIWMVRGGLNGIGRVQIDICTIGVQVGDGVDGLGIAMLDGVEVIQNPNITPRSVENFADAQTSSTTTVVFPTANLDNSYIGAVVSGADFPDNATIKKVVDAHTAILRVAATGTHNPTAATITKGAVGLYVKGSATVPSVVSVRALYIDGGGLVNCGYIGAQVDAGNIVSFTSCLFVGAGQQPTALVLNGAAQVTVQDVKFLSWFDSNINGSVTTLVLGPTNTNGTLRDPNLVASVSDTTSIPPGFGMRSGGWYVQPAGALTTLLMTDQRAFYVIRDVYKTVTIDKIGVEVTTIGGAGSVCRLGIMTDDGSGSNPATVIQEGDAQVACTGLGVVTTTFTPSVVLTPGRYWFVVCPQGAPAPNPTLRTNSSTVDPRIALRNINDVSASAYIQNAVAGALPNNPGALADSGNAPLIRVHVA